MPPRSSPDVAAPPRVSWDDFLTYHFDWQQGEHISLIGPTGGGKSTLAAELLHRRSYVVVFGSKPTDGDALLNSLHRKRGYKLVRDWPKKLDLRRPEDRRLLLWPRFDTFKDAYRQRDVFANALDDIFPAGKWCVVIDEGHYATKKLGLRPRFELIWQQGRSIGLSLVMCIQRPAHVPLEAYDAATHLFFWRDNDKRNLDRIGGIGWLDSGRIREAVAQLAKHDVLYLNTRDGTMLVTRADIR